MDRAPIDLRSDTVTRPTPAMRAAMAAAEVGDDVFEDDPTVEALQGRVAALLGKEAALFVPSGTMANQLALRVHTRPGDEVVVHARAHVMDHETGAAGALAGVVLRPIDSPDGTLPLGALEAALRTVDDVHVARTALVCLENTHNACGGVPVPVEHLHAVARHCHARGIAVHLDGARLFNAAVALGEPVARLAAPFDTVSVCFSKGLGAPVGSVLAGPRVLVRRARRYRKMYGGGMRQVGILAAAALHALDHHVDRLADDHRRARRLAEALAAQAALVLDPEAIRTNIVYFDVHPDHPLAAIEADGQCRLVHVLRRHGVLLTAEGRRVRAVTHLDVDDAAIERAIATVAEVLAGGGGTRRA